MQALTTLGNLVGSGSWKLESTKHAQIIALTTQLSEMKQELNSLSKINKPKDSTNKPTSGDKKTGNFEEWRLTKVNNNVEFNMVEKDGKKFLNGPKRRIEIITDIFLLPFIFSVRAAISFLLFFQALLSQKHCPSCHWVSLQGDLSSCSMGWFSFLAIHFELHWTFLARTSLMAIYRSNHFRNILSKHIQLWPKALQTISIWHIMQPCSRLSW